MVLTEAPKNETQVKPQINIWENEKPANRFEISEMAIFGTILICGLIGLVLLFLSA